MNLEESVHNYVFRGTLIGGIIAISGYSTVFGTGVTTNCLRGMYAIVNQKLVGYVVSNTMWIDGGMTVTLGYNTTTIPGLVDVMFVFPVGRLSINTAQITTKAQSIVLSGDSTPTRVQVVSMAQEAMPSTFSSAVMLRAAPQNIVTSPIDTTKVRGGVYMESY
jgi:hypothetical protein